MNKYTSIICLLLLSIIAFTGAVPVMAQSASVDELSAMIDGIIAYKQREAGVDTPAEWLDGALAEGAGSTSEWFIVALRQYDAAADFTAYANALDKFLADNDTANVVTRQRYMLALVACGQTRHQYIASQFGESVGKQGVMSWVFGLHLLNNGIEASGYSASDVVSKLLSLRLSDGGWALTGERSDVDVTAMTVQALATYYSSDEDVRAAVDGALGLLSERQLDDGGYMSFGKENPESSAQVVIALSSLGIDPETDSRFVKNGCSPLDGMNKYKLNDGSFCHTEDGGANQTATAQALMSLVALWRLRSGLGPLYIFSEQSATESAATDMTETASPADTTGTVPTEEDLVQADATTSVPLSGISYKAWVCLAILAAMLISAVILRLRGKRHVKSYIFVLVIGALACCAVIFTDFKSADDYYGVPTDKDAVGTVTLTIRCDTLVGKADSEYIPSDGVILPETELPIADGDTVYDILTDAAKEFRIQIENDGAGGLAYISGINYLYELAYGDLSGWVYHVDGEAPSVGCGEFCLSDGERVEWLYTCDLGGDLEQK